MKRIATITAGIAGFLAPIERADAQDAGVAEGTAAAADCEGAGESPISGELTLTATTHYFFRGLIQEDQGLIFQPEIALSAPLWEGDGWLRTLDLTTYTWNSLHSGPTGTGGTGNNSPSAWYESDWAAGLSLGLRCGTTLDLTWVEYTSPNGLFSTASELNLELDFSGTEALGVVAYLAPSLTLAFEVDGQSDQSTAPGGTDEGIFLGIGFAPEFDGGKLGELPITWSVPLNYGFSLDSYYEDAGGSDDTYGYADVGLFASFPLASRFGEWNCSVGTQLVFLNGNQEDLNHGAGVEWTGTLALSIGF
ncbi:MAG: hypothetical protein FJ293_10870 [Planctomycetes bacterium]|nr:hypothetical protein [Planctomycetota bacterium]